jgi:hypothetical protein
MQVAYFKVFFSLILSPVPKNKYISFLIYAPSKQASEVAFLETYNAHYKF